MDFIMQPWPWYVGGPLIGIIMLLLILCGKSFGFSSNFRNMCSMLGAGKSASFFDFDWRTQKWNLLFLVGAVLGGFIAAFVLSNNQIPAISTQTIADLQALGFASAGQSYEPTELFNVLTVKNVAILLIGGILVGFGSR